MIIVLKPEATEREIDHLLDRLRELGLKSHISQGEERTIVGVSAHFRPRARALQIRYRERSPHQPKGPPVGTDRVTA